MDNVAFLLNGGLSHDAEAYLIKILSYVIFAFAFLIFVDRDNEAPYGRYAVQYKGCCGCQINSRIGWFVQELPSLFIPILCLLLVNEETSKINNGLTANSILLACFIVHYIHRALIYPLLIRGNSPITCFTFFFAIVFCFVNGYVQGRHLTAFASYPEEWLYDPRFISGIVLFFIGMAVNIHADHTLRNLRKTGEKGYKIPRGGLFEYVSGANFFGETVEWIGYGLASWSLVGLTIPIITISNTLPRGIHHHRYYLEKFEDYPKKRKAIIPFIL